MKLGFIPPMLRGSITRPEFVSDLVELLEECGVESVWTVEHVVVAEDYEPRYPYSPDGRMPSGGGEIAMPDPLEWLAFAAARTQTLRLGTSVVVASQHSAAILAKRVATLDALSRGRVLLGVGLGWQKEEYEAIGVPYRARGRRLDETIEAMRALWGPGPSTYRGRHVSFERVHCDPKPFRPEGVPIVIGGSSEVAARRAGRLGDGFYPYVISAEDLAKRLELIRATAREAGRDPGRIELTVWPGSYDFARAWDLDFVRRYVELGTSRLILSAMEGGASTLEEVRRLVGSYQDRVLAKL